MFSLSAVICRQVCLSLKSTFSIGSIIKLGETHRCSTLFEEFRSVRFVKIGITHHDSTLEIYF